MDKENKIQANWIKEKVATLNENLEYEQRPALKFERGKVTTFTVDFEKPFNTHKFDQGGKSVTKMIIPVTHNNEKKFFWLNEQNPICRKLLEKGAQGQTKFSVMKDGDLQNSKFTLLDI